MRCLPVLLMVVLAGAGCASPKEAKDEAAKATPKERAKSSGKAQPNPAPVIQPVSAFSGKVVLVNAPLKYVVVEGTLGRLPPVEQTLNVYRDGQKVGVVVVSNQARGANFAADLTQGEARVGDTVRSD
ncbi:MAG: hypothetical protein FD161_1480 [Limisphaerales bacterium]|nr:MAG: hypothetical protein FD161_1480 [Limisphaerales bacterium]KAG0509557.1 MAG: hypothetical protein E1N63_1399 [Limisphaerales bacterium]TXT52393.1 MAG: hypothetical protein FD140_880 [Limisphaerales bacterium]